MATSVLTVLLVMVFSAISQVSSIWSRSMDKIESFKGARLAFESITRNLSQATLNTYLDYVYDGNGNPKRYMRKSELRFIAGAAGSPLASGATMPGTAGTGSAFFFQAPMGYTTDQVYSGMESLLYPCGYFVSFAQNNTIPSHVAVGNNPYRYRLMQMLVSTGSNTIYTTGTSTTWFTAFAGSAVPVADNVIALIVRPQDPGSLTQVPPNDSYFYDSTLNATADPQPITANQLPPVVQVTMVAIDETSAKRLENGSTPPAAIAAAMAGKFSDPANYQADLDALTASLRSSRINYRVFSSAVPIRESKWTK